MSDVEGLSLCLYVKRRTNPPVAVFVRGRVQRSPPYQTSKAPTLEGNRGVGQIKQSYPVASVIACVL